MAHKHRYTTVAGTSGGAQRCSCGRTSIHVTPEEGFKSGRARREARSAARKAAR